jgi:hypothetical protein
MHVGFTIYMIQTGKNRKYMHIEIVSVFVWKDN